MAQVARIASQRRDAVDALSEGDRRWLAERLVDYRDLLDFLRTS
jgi:hypothetical protein